MDRAREASTADSQDRVSRLSEDLVSPPVKEDDRPPTGAPPVPVDGKEVSELIALLDTDDKYLRRPARDKLAGFGPDAVRPMMERFSDAQASYRARLGILVALTTMLRNDKALAPQVREMLSSPEDLKALALAIDHEDRTLRQYATEFLYDLGDIRILEPALEVAEKTQSDQSRYQAIFVVKGVYGALDASARRDAEARLKKLERPSTPRTNDLINEILKQ
jgi:hypothetical protein